MQCTYTNHSQDSVFFSVIYHLLSTSESIGRCKIPTKTKESTVSVVFLQVFLYFYTVPCCFPTRVAWPREINIPINISLRSVMPFPRAAASQIRLSRKHSTPRFTESLKLCRSTPELTSVELFPWFPWSHVAFFTGFQKRTMGVSWKHVRLVSRRLPFRLMTRYNNIKT